MTAHVMQEPTAQCNREVHCKYLTTYMHVNRGSHKGHLCIANMLICVYVFLFEQRFGSLFAYVCVYASQSSSHRRVGFY